MIWTSERISKLTAEELKNLATNATVRGNREVAFLFERVTSLTL